MPTTTLKPLQPLVGAAEAGDPRAQRLYARLLVHGSRLTTPPVQPDPQRALHYYLASAGAGASAQPARFSATCRDGTRTPVGDRPDEGEDKDEASRRRALEHAVRMGFDATSDGGPSGAGGLPAQLHGLVEAAQLLWQGPQTVRDRVRAAALLAAIVRHILAQGGTDPLTMQLMELLAHWYAELAGGPEVRSAPENGASRTSSRAASLPENDEDSDDSAKDAVPLLSGVTRAQARHAARHWLDRAARLGSASAQRGIALTGLSAWAGPEILRARDRHDAKSPLARGQTARQRREYGVAVDCALQQAPLDKTCCQAAAQHFYQRAMAREAVVAARRKQMQPTTRIAIKATGSDPLLTGDAVVEDDADAGVLLVSALETDPSLAISVLDREPGLPDWPLGQTGSDAENAVIHGLAYTFLTTLESIHGDGSACLVLAEAFLEGHLGLAVDGQRAIALLERGRELGEPLALQRLGLLYYEGHKPDIPQDVMTGMTYLIDATRQAGPDRSPLRQQVTALLLSEGNDRAQTIAFLNEAAADGDAHAAVLLAEQAWREGDHARAEHFFYAAGGGYGDIASADTDDPMLTIRLTALPSRAAARGRLGFGHIAGPAAAAAGFNEDARVIGNIVDIIEAHLYIIRRE
ncbi:hypothetical protein CXG81DRAFT_20468 [Caulochytrium protostelioides]|uniref:HCP-like protein n=1 Tax=Caulochytrium protostelioides TaxID=1555241 RepID=A0A4P9X361_9FUNG|nr:hypothetical protein CXG81DRAFT_20468 [Caulochytrium protostelioides]|eukprot:RKO99452.1 hypothetical protein CXG81DRAFT_20468 [Caulochytrium protostelioides]